MGGTTNWLLFSLYKNHFFTAIYPNGVLNMKILHVLYWVLSSFQILALAQWHTTHPDTFLYLFFHTLILRSQKLMCYSIPILGDYMEQFSLMVKWLDLGNWLSFWNPTHSKYSSACFVTLNKLRSISASVPQFSSSTKRENISSNLTGKLWWLCEPKIYKQKSIWHRVSDIIYCYNLLLLLLLSQDVYKAKKYTLHIFLTYQFHLTTWKNCRIFFNWKYCGVKHKIHCNAGAKTQDFKEIKPVRPLQVVPKPAPSSVLSSLPWNLSSGSSAMSPVQSLHEPLHWEHGTDWQSHKSLGCSPWS